MLNTQQGLCTVEAKSAKQIKEFIYLPEQIHKNHSNWLPPIYIDERNFFNPKKNIAFSHCDTIMLLALQNGRPVGRIMGIIHKTYNALHGEKTARFGFFDCYNIPEVAQLLISEIEHWAKSKGMTRIIGPYGFSDKDPQGFLIDGFEHMPVLDSACNLPYMVDFVEQAGYTKEVDCLIYTLDIDKGLPESYNRIIQRVEANNGFQFIEISKRSQLKQYILPILRMVNETYSELFGFVPMEEQEMLDFAKRYLPIVNPKFVKIATVGDKLAGFIIGLPNFTPGIQKAKGRLFPFGIFHILRAMRRTNQLDLMLGAVDKEFRGRGLEIAMAIRMINSCKEAGLDRIEIHLVLETNTAMIAELERANCNFHKRFRVFGKDVRC